ncbi:hypothetical protein ACFQZZ_12830 [Nocardia sp. GCM10030253]|uniref:hypothetical protein n=1 Tax=Nocardia sp. GCM10030253 TaxID=3273404 RepID=UPI003635AF9D
MTTTLHVDNTVHDFDTWKAVFDKFDQFRTERNVRSYRIGRLVDAPDRVFIDLDFDSRAYAESFRDDLRKVTATPQSQALLIAHETHLVEVVDQPAPAASPAG